MVDIGKMNRRITFLRLETTEDEMGQDKSGWKKYRTVWATIKPYKSSEYNFMSKLSRRLHTECTSASEKILLQI